MIFLILFIVIISVIALFSFPRFSPIPYFPSNMKDRENILKALSLKNSQTIIDLGAGDGVVVFEAACKSWRRGLDTRYIALEINPILVAIMWVKWFFHPNKKNIRIVWGNMFEFNFKNVTGYMLHVTCYLYISPWLIEKVISRIKKQLPHAQFVSYYYSIKSMKGRENVLKGVHDVYIYLSDPFEVSNER